MHGDAATIAALLAVDPAGLGGVALRSAAHAQRDAWLALLRQLLPAQAPLRRVPLNITDTALLGGLDLGATLKTGRPVALKGLLAQCDGGVVVLAMAERLSAGAAARFCAVLDTRQVALERDGLGQRNPTHLGVVALDEGASDEEQMPAALLERCSLRLVLDGSASDDEGVVWTPQDVAQARAMLARVRIDDSAVQALCAAALALGVDSLRGSLMAVQVARVAAALTGSLDVEEEHIALAARLVLAPRATRLPPAPEPQQDPQQETQQDQDPEPSSQAPQTPDEPAAQTDAQASEPPDDNADAAASGELQERVLEAAQAAIPQGLLASLKIAQSARNKAQSAGRAGAAQKSQLRGRPIGARRGEPRAGQRLNVIETLRAAAPWQKIRRAERPTPLRDTAVATAAPARIQVRKEDFHVSRFRQLGQTTTVFVVDASGSAALNRLAEAKGAVELLLADCYVRRDSVAVVAFRGKAAELLLPPTRSLARAKRSLAGLPGGGGTPLANGIDAARELGELIRRKGETPIIVLLTDGRGNISRDGTPGRAQAALDATLAAQQLRLAGMTALLMDTSPHAQPVAQELARAMGATYLPLPYAGAQAMSLAVRAVATLAAAPR